MNNYNQGGASDTNTKYVPPSYADVVGGERVNSSTNNQNMPPYPPTNAPSDLNSSTTYGWNPNAPSGQPQMQQQQQQQPIVIQVEPGYGGYGRRRWNMSQIPPEHMKYVRIFMIFFMLVFVIILIIIIIGFVRAMT